MRGIPQAGLEAGILEEFCPQAPVGGVADGFEEGSEDGSRNVGAAETAASTRMVAFVGIGSFTTICAVSERGTAMSTTDSRRRWNLYIAICLRLG